MFRILTRYVVDQVLRSFLLALVTITAIFVLFMVMAEATRALTNVNHAAIRKISKISPTPWIGRGLVCK